MWFLILVFNAVVLFIFYRIFSDRAAKNSGLTEVVDRFKKEINAVAVNFNRISADNVSLLEEKSLEVRELIKLVNSRIEEYRKLQEKYGVLEKQMSEKLPVSAVHTTVSSSKLYIPDAGQKKARKGDERAASVKAEQVLKFFDEGKAIDRIARELDISELEVKYYLKRSPNL